MEPGVDRARAPRVPCLSGGLLSHGLLQRVREHETPLHQSPINAGGGDGGRAEDRRGGNGRLRQRWTGRRRDGGLRGQRIQIFVAQRRLNSGSFSAGKTVSLAASALCPLLQPAQRGKGRNVKTRWEKVIKVKLSVRLKCV